MCPDRGDVLATGPPGYSRSIGRNQPLPRFTVSFRPVCNRAPRTRTGAHDRRHTGHRAVPLGTLDPGSSRHALQARRVEGVRGRHERHGVRARYAARTDDGHDARRDRAVRARPAQRAREIRSGGRPGARAKTRAPTGTAPQIGPARPKRCTMLSPTGGATAGSPATSASPRTQSSISSNATARIA